MISAHAAPPRRRVTSSAIAKAGAILRIIDIVRESDETPHPYPIAATKATSGKNQWRGCMLARANQDWPLNQSSFTESDIHIRAVDHH